MMYRYPTQKVKPNFKLNYTKFCVSLRVIGSCIIGILVVNNDNSYTIGIRRNINPFIIGM